MVLVGVFVIVEVFLLLIGVWLIFKISLLEFKLKLAQDQFHRLAKIARAGTKGLQRLVPVVEGLLVSRLGFKGKVAYFLFQMIPSSKQP